MSYEDYEDKPKKSYSKDTGRIYTGPCEYCRKRVKGCSIDKDGCIKCPECGNSPRVAKKL